MPTAEAAIHHCPPIPDDAFSVVAVRSELDTLLAEVIALLDTTVLPELGKGRYPDGQSERDRLWADLGQPAMPTGYSRGP